MGAWFEKTMFICITRHYHVFSDLQTHKNLILAIPGYLGLFETVYFTSIIRMWFVDPIFTCIAKQFKTLDHILNQ